MRLPIPNFTALDSAYGKFIVNRHCAHHAETLAKTGLTHIEPELAKILAIIRTLPPGSLAIDAGANIGFIAIPIAQELQATGGMIHAFEVQRMLFYALCGSAALNGLTNLHIHNIALGAASGLIPTPQPDYGAAQDFGLYSLATPISSPVTETVPLITIDQLRLPRLDFLKIDVEGMEPDILEGAAATIRACTPWCWVEYWKTGIAPLKAAFTGADYRFFPLDPLNLLCAPTAKLAASGLRIEGCEV